MPSLVPNSVHRSPCMAKLDKLGWPVGLSVVSHGVRLGIRANRADILPRLLDRLPSGWKRERARRVDRLYSVKAASGLKLAAIREFNLLYEDIARLTRTLDFDEVLDRFESHAQLYIAERIPHRVVLRGGAVVWNGRAILFPGDDESGKTVLALALVRAGATYYSDGYAALDSAGRVHPFLRPLSIAGSNGKRTRKNPEELGRTAGGPGVPVGLIVLTRYQAGARWRPRRLSKGRSLLELLGHAVSAHRKPRSALTTLRRVVARAPALSGPRGEATATARALLEYVESTGSSPVKRGRLTRRGPQRLRPR